MSQDKSTLIEQEILKKKASGIGPSSPLGGDKIPRYTGDDPAPLSFGQQRLWFLQQMQSNSAAYHMTAAYRMRGKLDPFILEQSLKSLITRHKTLRTVYETLNSRPVQRILDAWNFKLQLHNYQDITGIDPLETTAGTLSSASDAGEADLNRALLEPLDNFLSERVGALFDLNRDLMIRGDLIRISPDDAILLLVKHHIASDGWSWGILLRELELAYTAFSNGDKPEFPELSIEYSDYARWQQDTLNGDGVGVQLAYWKNQLKGLPEVLDLPGDRLRPLKHTANGAREHLAIPALVIDSLKKLGQSERATLFMALTAAYDVLLNKYTQLEDIAVGSPIAGRTQLDTEGIIGFFVNTLVIRNDLSGNPSFREILKRVREPIIGAFVHQNLPFEKLVEELNLQRNLSFTPLFQVAIVLQNTPGERFNLPGIDVNRLTLKRETAQFDITLSIYPFKGDYQAHIGYNTDIFDASTIKRFLTYYNHILNIVSNNPDIRLSDISLLDEDEKRVILDDWNDTDADFPDDKCLHQLFESQVEKTPGAIAVKLGDEELTYEQLNRHANRLAHYLIEMGVKPDSTVGVCVPRSIDMIIAVLGVLKSGGAYVPMDSNYPAKRLDYMLKDSGAGLLITFESAAERIEEYQGKKLLLDREHKQVSRYPDSNPGSDVSSGNLANIIYTSGSTGVPKGVMIEHRSLVHRVLAMRDFFRLTPSDRQFQFVSISFDVWGEEVFPILCSGGSLLLVSDTKMLTTSQLLDQFERYGVTKVNLPGITWTRLVDEISETGRTLPMCVNRLVLGGEAPPFDKVAQLNKSLDHPLKIFNAYGPTEATIMSNIFEIPDTFLEGDVRRRVPIGRPLPNTKLYVLNSEMQPIPIGVAGELWIGGTGVARGYLNDPEKTANVFHANPFTGIEGDRLYRTGDLVRLLEDGNMEFLGRIDNQVKVRGFRIEPEEVEEVIRQHPRVKDAAVIISGDDAGNKRLISFIVPSAAAIPDNAELRSFLLERLPDYMIPVNFSMIDKMPLSPTGKLDRKILQSLQNNDLKSRQFVAPRNALERFIVDIYRETLQLDEVSIYDDFFELGGESINGALLINKLQEKLDKYIYVVTLFDAPTPEKLALYLVRHYKDAVAGRFGKEVLDIGEQLAEETASVQISKITDREVEELRQAIMPLPEREKADTSSRKSKRVIFVLTPPRSGSTLLRVMLGGHPQLFAPPELYLMSFNTLGERNKSFTGRFNFWREGLLRAVMEVKKCDLETAREVLEEYESRDVTVKEFYGIMQEWIGDKFLVDKTPFYPLDTRILNRMEEDFEDPFYIHLIRHPYGMINSFLEAKTENLFRYEHPFTGIQLAELIWLITHENVLSFLKNIPQERHFPVKFEQLVKNPQQVMMHLCDRMGIDFNEEMIQPYKEKKKRMTDSIHPLSMMLGDVKFHNHKGVNDKTADRWKDNFSEDFLSDKAWEIAEKLGYEKPKAEMVFESTGWETQSDRVVSINKDGKQEPLFLIPPAGAIGLHFVELARHLGKDQPIYVLNPSEIEEKNNPHLRIREIAELCIREIRQIKSDGPYLLGGSCFGGYLAYEIAQQLTAEGVEIPLLILFDVHGPEFKRHESTAMFHFKKLWRLKPSDYPQYIQDRIAGIKRRTRRKYFKLGFYLFDRYKVSLPGVLENTREAHNMARFNYVPQIYPGKAIIFQAEEQPEGFYNYHKGWDGLFQCGLEVRKAPGSHRTMMRNPNIGRVAGELKAFLETVKIPG